MARFLAYLTEAEQDPYARGQTLLAAGDKSGALTAFRQYVPGKNRRKDAEVAKLLMLLRKQVTESFDDSPYRPTTLPLSEYRGLGNPLNDDQPYGPEYKEASDLWDIVEDQIDAGIIPKKLTVNTKRLLATQDWLSSEAGDEALFPEYSDAPVILEYQGKEYILDGHNRIAKQQARGKHNIVAYVFTVK